MSDLPLHPAVVHIPLGITLIMPFLTLCIWFGIRKNFIEQRTWLVIILLQALILGSAVAALKTGEHEEERVEKIVSENFIEEHEERAEFFVYLSGAVFVLSIFGFILEGKRREIAQLGYCTATVIALATALSVGHSGGELVFKYNAGAAYLTGVQNQMSNTNIDSENNEE